MPRVSFAFYIAAVIFGLIGMSLGIAMGATETFTLMPVHAHINLLGWVTLALMGTFYAFAGERAPKVLPWVNFGLSTVGLLICAPMLTLVLLGDKSVVPLLAISELLLLSGMATFATAVGVTAYRGRRASGAAKPVLRAA